MAAAYEKLDFVRHVEPEAQEVWVSIARCYAAFGSPLVPCRDDIAAFERAVAVKARQDQGTAGGVDALVLGVTPGITSMNWPPNSRITAVDMSSAVIEAMWPGDIPGCRKAVCAPWLSIPIEPKSCDVVVGDGSLNACRFPSEVRTLLRAVSHYLKDEGILSLRTFIRPLSPEPIASVFHAVTKGLGVDGFKMRLWMAMQRCAEEGVAVRDAAQALREYNLDCQVMHEHLGWSLEAIEPFSTWPSSEAVYTFPSLSELRGSMAEFFDEVSISWPNYELGHCCPVIVMRKK